MQMNKHARPALAILCILAACGHDSKLAAPPLLVLAPPSDVLTPDNVYGAAMPTGATEVPPEDLAAKVQSGDVTLAKASDEQTAAQTADDQAVKDRAFLESLGSKSAALALLLAPKVDVALTAGRDFSVQVDGGKKSVMTLGDELMLRAMVKGYETSQDPANAAAVYALGYATAPAALLKQLPTPASLAGAPLADVQAAIATLDKLLSAQPDPIAAAVSSPARDITIIPGGYGAGAGSDGPGACATDASGIYSQLNWPLKGYLPPMRDQAQRGTCWAFASLGAIETRERVVNDRTVNLSEQYAVNVHKRDAVLGIDFLGEGDVNYWMLDKFVARNWPIAFETEWTYNAGYGRVSEGSFSHICDGYSGYCSETNAEGPTTCANNATGLFCGYQNITYAGASDVRADHARQIWLNVFTAAPVALMRSLIANGQPLMASFPVLEGFDTTDRGYVTNYGSDHNRGGHYIMLVGFAPDSAVPFAPAVGGGTGGGFFIAKNSWGCTGDGGFYYIPVSYMQRFFWDVSVLESSSSRSAAWSNTLATFQQPTITLSTLSGGTSAPLNRDVSVSATIIGGGAGCCGITWSPTPTYASGNTATFHFTSVGPQTITASITTAGGVSATASLLLNVANAAPRAIIEAPVGGVVYRGQSLSYSGYGLDPNEGPGPGDGRTGGCHWTSSNAGDASSSSCTGSFLFTTNGTRTLTLRVTDSLGATGQATVDVVVQDPPVTVNQPPVGSFSVSSSVASTPYDWTDLLTFTGSATDAENNAPFAYAWTATALSETGVVGNSISLGSTATVTWTPENSYSFFFGPGTCQSINGERVRITLVVTDSAGQVSSPVVHEIRIVCTPG
jgi:hypothetical protein